jgi:long-chain acyl-CoA synthetase
MIGNKRNFPSALIVPNFDNLQKWARAHGVSAASGEDLVRDPRVIALYDQTVKELTKDLAQFERIKKVALLPREFSLEAGELTPTLKVKRKVVEQKYKDVIDRLYEDAAA